jgi:signal transduction histidine kinase
MNASPVIDPSAKAPRMFRWFVILLCLLPFPVARATGPLTSLSDLRGLSAEVASSGVPVSIEGTVVGLVPSAPFHFFLHDGTSGCFIKTILKGRPAIPVVPGDRVMVTGVSDALGYYPSVKDGHVRVLGKAPLPLPVTPDAGELFSPHLDSQWVEVPAIVTGFEIADKCVTLNVEVHGLPFKAELPPSPDAEKTAVSLMQQPVRMRGIIGTIFNAERQMTDRHFFVPDFAAIVPAAPTNTGGIPPLLDVSRLLTGSFGPTALVRLRGVVTQLDRKGFYLRDSTGSTLILTADADDFAPGSMVEAEGFGMVAPFRPVLRAIRVVKSGESTPITPVAFDYHKENLSSRHSEWITLEADFLGQTEGRGEAILQFSKGGRFFEGLLPEQNKKHPVLAAGDRVRLTGICELTTSKALPRIDWVDGFRILLPQNGGIEIVSRAPWWTPRRLLFALGIMSGAAALGFSGTWLLRRQVKGQMLIISDKLRNEAVGEERDRMARELHDTLEQQLSGVALQLDSLDHAITRNPAAAADTLSLARRMLRYTRNEARRSVWNLRSKVLEQDGLTAALSAITETAGSTRSTVEFVVRGNERPLPPGADMHLLRIAQEAITNSTKHGGAAHIRMELEYLAEITRLTITDDGSGFDPSASHLISGSHFGLLGMRERAGKIGACLTVLSSPAQGCTVTVALPHRSSP